MAQPNVLLDRGQYSDNLEDYRLHQTKGMSLVIYNETQTTVTVTWEKIEEDNSSKTKTKRKYKLPNVENLDDVVLDALWSVEREIELDYEYYCYPDPEETSTLTLIFTVNGTEYKYEMNLKFAFHPTAELNKDELEFPGVGFVAPAMRYDDQKKQTTLVLYIVEHYKEMVPLMKPGGGGHQDKVPRPGEKKDNK